MPTLRPQNVSGLVVIPTVESVPGIHRVSIAVNVGSSRLGDPASAVISREDLVVELRNAAEGSFEPIASPDPGPLPVRALRVEQARGEFTFAQGVNAPDELVVTLRGDRKSFPMSQLLSPTACLKKEPGPGDPFSDLGRRTLPKQILDLLPLRRSRCCVKRFDTPLISSTNATAKNQTFKTEAAFIAKGRKCSCKCCEFRLFVRGTFTDAAGAPVRFDLPSGGLSPKRYCEDGTIDEFGPGKHGYYGHRATSSPGDTYGGTGTAQGCTYRADEKVSCPPTDGLHLEFLGLIVDRCRGTVVEKKTWVVDL